MTREQALEIILDPRGGPAEGTPKHRELMTFLEGSPECREIYLQQRQVWESLDLWEEVEPSAGFDRRFDGGGRARRRGFAVVRPMDTALAAEFRAGSGGAGTDRHGHHRQAARLGFPSRREIAEDAAYVEEIHETLDDLEMLADFDALPLGG